MDRTEITPAADALGLFSNEPTTQPAQTPETQTPSGDATAAPGQPPPANGASAPVSAGATPAPAAPTSPPPTAPGQTPPAGYVPHHVVGELREGLRQQRQQAEFYAAQAAQAQQMLQQFLAQQQGPKPAAAAPQPPPDPLTDPAGFQRYHEAKLEERAAALEKQFSTRQAELQMEAIRTRNTMSHQLALRSHTPDAINEAVETAKAVGILAQFQSEPDPYGALMTWRNATRVLAEVGHDPKAYRERVIGEELRNPEFVQRVAQQLRIGTPPPVTPPSLSGTPRAGQPGAEGAASFSDWARSAFATPQPQRR